MKRLISIACIFVIASGISYSQNNLSIGVWGGLAVPTGHFGDIHDSGIGLGGNVEYRLNPTWSITGSAGFNRWSLSEVLVDELGLDHEEIYETSLTTVPLLAGVRYYLSTGGISPYAAGEIGIHIVSWDESFLDETISGSGSDIGVGVGGGAVIHLNPTVQIDASVKYNTINTEGESIDYLSAFIGVRFVL